MKILRTLLLLFVSVTLPMSSFGAESVGHCLHRDATRAMGSQTVVVPTAAGDHGMHPHQVSATAAVKTETATCKSACCLGSCSSAQGIPAVAAVISFSESGPVSLPAPSSQLRSAHGLAPLRPPITAAF